MNNLFPVLILGAFDLFMPSFRQEYFFTKTQRALNLNEEISVQELGPIGRVLSPDAIATYNGNLNIISLNKAHMRNGQIKTAQEIMGPLADYSKLGTIFHEMGHAEMDVFIESEVTERDALVMYHYDNNLKAFYQKHFPKFTPWTIFHEHFGYYRAELIDFLSTEQSNVLMYNGYNKFKKSCFLTPPLKKMLKDNVSLEEFQKLLVPAGEDDFFRKKVGPRFIFVKGQDLDFDKVPKDMIRQTHDLFWAYHQDFYGFPINKKDLVKRMNAQGRFMKDLKACRTKFWNEAN